MLYLSNESGQGLGQGRSGPLGAGDLEHLAKKAVALVQEPRPREARQRPQVDVRLVEAVVAGNEAGEHAGIGRVRVARYHRHANSGHAIHAEALDHADVTVAATDENEVLQDWRAKGHAEDCSRPAPVRLF